jgi:hypothetical protein
MLIAIHCQYNCADNEDTDCKQASHTKTQLKAIAIKFGTIIIAA